MGWTGSVGGGVVVGSGGGELLGEWTIGWLYLQRPVLCLYHGLVRGLVFVCGFITSASRSGAVFFVIEPRVTLLVFGRL